LRLKLTNLPLFDNKFTIFTEIDLKYTSENHGNSTPAKLLRWKNLGNSGKKRNITKFSGQKKLFSLGVEYRVIASMARNRINMFVLFLYERISATIIKYRE
jgi:hypothetical protein